MSRVLTIAAKELRSYVVSPVAWVMAMVFLVVAGLFFYLTMVEYTNASYVMMQGVGAEVNVNAMVFPPTFSTAAVTLLFLVPMITMRLIAEERKARTAQLLFTSPVRLGEIVAGKFAAAALLVVAILFLTAYMPLLVGAFVAFDWGPVLTSYLGLALFASSAVALGLFASSLTENQIIAAAATFGILLLLWFIGWAGQPGTDLAAVLQHLSITSHLEGFLQGSVHSKDVVYYLSVTALGLFLTHRVLDSSRWR